MAPRGHIVVVAATNRPNAIDPGTSIDSGFKCSIVYCLTMVVAMSYLQHCDGQVVLIGKSLSILPGKLVG